MTVYNPVGGKGINDKWQHAHTGVYVWGSGERWGTWMIGRRWVKFDVADAWDAPERTNETEGENV